MLSPTSNRGETTKEGLAAPKQTLTGRMAAIEAIGAFELFCVFSISLSPKDLDLKIRK